MIAGGLGRRKSVAQWGGGGGGGPVPFRGAGGWGCRWGICNAGEY
jgi:hypothetical protein